MGHAHRRKRGPKRGRRGMQEESKIMSADEREREREREGVELQKGRLLQFSLQAPAAALM